METDDDGTSAIHFGRLPRRIYVSRSFPDRPTNRLRYVSQVFDQKEGLSFVDIKDEIVLQVTPSGRTEVRAKIVEDDRQLVQLLIQKFDSSKPSKRQFFTFQGAALGKLLNLLESVKTMPMEHGEKFHLSAAEADNAVLTKDTATKLFGSNEELFLEIARDSSLKADIIALGYRRQVLKTFEQMLTDPIFFAQEEARVGKRAESLWQAFFEANTWIFGYGLAYQFLGKVDEGKLERTIVGFDLGGRGKEPDAVMKTQSRINSLCFVEVKMHNADLLQPSPYRGDAWMPAKELVGGVSQVQAAVQSAIERYTPRLQVTDKQGNPSAEPIFNIDPRAFLIVGDLGEFATDRGVNLSKFRSFESFRRNLRRPEIITFDELLDRARFIVEHEPAGISPMAPEEDDVPF